ncbi:MAG TPA: filamentous hemagglutinin N-terminal domain-containing protein, partial [Vineibacter sp.]|nr:filamentous hemagglutinin N-terminal domain-containing protein [Vineibacter sp.]
MARRVRSTAARRTVAASGIVPSAVRPSADRLMGGTALAALVAAGLVTLAARAEAQLSPTQLPTNGRPQVGTQAMIASSGSRMTVTQTSNRGVINWDSFSIGAQAQVTFQQPGASAVTLNQVTGPDPSVIAGRLNANGQLVLVNGAGVVFANGAQVNVGSLIAATARVANPQTFMKGGTIQFDRPSANPNAEISNAGTITVRDGGLVGLVGPSASNSGTINARLGRVTIGGSETFTVDLAGDGLVNFQIGQPVSQQPRDAQGNKKPLASNTGTINADGGIVTLTARAAGAVVDNVINVGGAIRARAVSQEGGTVVFGGEDNQTVTMSGTVDVSGKGAGQRGGKVIATSRGGIVNLAASTQIDASGHSGGGAVNIGGSYQGKGPLPNARNTTVQPGAQINADATGRGNGGTVVVWADNATVFGGMISARGGPKGGDGGFVEVSGKNHLDYRGAVDLRATAGTIGRLLLDPGDLVISDSEPETSLLTGGGDPITFEGGDFFTGHSVLSVTRLQGALATADVAVNATRLSTSGGVTISGSITVGSAVTVPGGRTLTLNADGSIDVAAPILTTGAGANLVLNAGGPIANTEAGTINIGGGTLTLSAGNGVILSAAAVVAGTVNFTAGGAVSIDNVGNAIGTFASVASSAGGNVSLRSASPLAIGDGGITTPAGISLISDGA